MNVNSTTKSSYDAGALTLMSRDIEWESLEIHNFEGDSEPKQ